MAQGRASTTTLILGGSGFLGAHLVAAALADDAARVVAASREPAQRPRAGSERDAIERAVDALTPGAIERLLDELAPDVIVLASALARIADCERYPKLAATLNVDLPARVARWTAASRRRLLHVSTDLVFGAAAPPRGRFREHDPVGPTSEYGRSKARGEQAVLENDARALVVRLPLLFGDSFGRGLGASDALVAQVERGERVSLFVDEWRTPLDVAQAARATVELAATPIVGLLHLAGDERVSRAELGARVLAARRVDPTRVRELVRSATRAELGMSDRPSDVSLDGSRAAALLSFRLSSIDEALRTR